MSFVLNSNKYGSVGEYIKENIKKGDRIDVSSSIFTIYAFEELRKSLVGVSSMRFLFNEPTFIRKLESNDKEVKEFQLQILNRERSLSEFPFEIGLKNNLDQNQIASICHKFIKKKVEVKSVLKPGILPSKNFFIRNESQNQLISGNSINFSLNGLGYTKKKRFDFNTVQTDVEITNQFEEYFDEIWNDIENVVDVKDKLLEHIQNLYKENSPQIVYYLTLYNLFGEKLLNLEDEAKIKEKTGINKSKVWNMLYNFQQDAVIGAIKKLQLYNGCIIADSVGLGKTFEALGVIKYHELRNERVLVLCPKKLRANWIGFKQNSLSNPLSEDRFNYHVLNHTDLSRNGGMTGDINLKTLNWGNYDLIVIDESHNFRNNPAVTDRETRYQKLMNKIIKSGVKTKVLMLSATPVNNSLKDLRNQIMFITEDNDAAFKESVGIESIHHTLRVAQQRFKEWSKLSKDQQTSENLVPTLDYNFFNLLNTVTIARSRKHIKKYYDTKDIGEFPRRRTPISIKADIDTENRFPELVEVNTMISSLNLANYSPLLYVLPTKRKEYEDLYSQSVKEGTSIFSQFDREQNLVNLMRINILKRLESSIHSFGLTIEKIQSQINDMLIAIESSSNLSAIGLDDIDDDNVVGKKIKVKVKDLDCLRLKQDLQEDLTILNKLVLQTHLITEDRDAKLIELQKLISTKINNPINHNNRKMIIFSAFSDTATYLYEALNKWIYDKYGLYTGIVTGSSATKTNHPRVSNSFEDILAYFSPYSNKIDVDSEIEILFATDCISEGQNLQDCDYLVNYDIHWNPVRIIQRFGRVDRIGSRNTQIQLVNFWPNLDLDEYINLEHRVRHRMMVGDFVSTGEDDLLNPESKDLKYRKDQLKQLQEEVVDLEDLSGNTSITDFTLDDFIMSLDKFMKNNPNFLEGYPTGVHAVTSITEKLKQDCVSGVIFCLKQIKYSEDEKKLNSLYPYHMVYVSWDGDIFVKNTNPKKILDIYKGLCSELCDVDEDLVKEFNEETRNGQDMKSYTSLLEKAVFDIKGIIEEKGLSSLFGLGGSSDFDSMISGKEDFELISFLVVK